MLSPNGQRSAEDVAAASAAPMTRGGRLRQSERFVYGMDGLDGEAWSASPGEAARLGAVNWMMFT